MLQEEQLNIRKNNLNQEIKEIDNKLLNIQKQAINPKFLKFLADYGYKIKTDFMVGFSLVSLEDNLPILQHPNCNLPFQRMCYQYITEKHNNQFPTKPEPPDNVVIKEGQTKI